MSVQAMTWAFEQDVEPNAKLVLLALANRANHESGICYPGQDLLARECSMSSRTVRRHLRTLADRGLIERRARMLPEGRGRTSDEYRLACYQPANMAERSRPTGQTVTTNRTNQDDQPDTAVQVTGREPKANRKVMSAKRLTSMTADWTPEPTNLEALKAKHRTLNVTAELEQFRDHWISKGERRADWNASLRTWMRNAERWAVRYEKPGTGHAGARKVAPDRCPDCAQLLDEHDEQVHDLLIGRI
jgi:DNA-binding transcriptional ArsR family regulator